jgi:hypothetical protein
MLTTRRARYLSQRGQSCDTGESRVKGAPRTEHRGIDRNIKRIWYFNNSTLEGCSLLRKRKGSDAYSSSYRKRHCSKFQHLKSAINMYLSFLVARPTLLDLPYSLLGTIFILSQSPNLMRVCRLFQTIGADPHVRAQYLEYQSLRREGSFFVHLLKQVPPAEHWELWQVLRNRKVIIALHT